MSKDKIRVEVRREVTSLDVHVAYMSQEEFDRMQAIDDLQEKSEYVLGLTQTLLDEEQVMDAELKAIEIGLETDEHHQVLLAEDEPAHAVVMG